MTGYRHTSFRHQCAKNGCYIETLPWWDELCECFPRRILPTDVDGMVEIDGHFLFMEEKRCGVGPDEGQRIALKRLSRMPATTVLLFRPGTDSHYEMLVFRKGSGSGWQKVSKIDLHEWVRFWVSEAESKKAPTAKELYERIAQLETQVDALQLAFSPSSMKDRGVS